MPKKAKAAKAAPKKAKISAKKIVTKKVVASTKKSASVRATAKEPKEEIGLPMEQPILGEAGFKPLNPKIDVDVRKLLGPDITHDITPSDFPFAEKRYFSPNSKTIDFPLPNLIEIQLESYKWFVEEGLRELFNEISPITDFSGKKLELHLLKHSIGEAKYDASTAKNKNLTFEAPLKLHVQLINKESGEIKEQDVFLGSIPLMTERGTFIVNGIERVVVSQLVRSPGVFYSKSTSSPNFFNAKIIPKRGAWLEVETDKKGIVTVKIDRKRKIPITCLLRIFGYATDKEILDIFGDVSDPTMNFILTTLDKDPAKTVDEAYKSIYRKIRPGDLATPENAKTLIQSMFFDYHKYDMGAVARYKLNKRFQLNTPNTRENHTFQVKDLIFILKELIRLNNGQGIKDDIDHLANRRIRAVGELVQNKFRVGLLRTDRIAKDRMTVMELETVTPTQLINSRPITAALREFFASSQLSQFMDQTNPLAELAHKRRLSAMGPGGLSRERASFDVRDVHPSHYGRICPIATPEGPNIGLVVHLATYARINKYGFIETPFRKVAHTAKNTVKDLTGRICRESITNPKSKKMIVKAGDVIDESAAAEITKAIDAKDIQVRAYLTDDVHYFDADEERGIIIAQANSKVDRVTGQFLETRVEARINHEPTMAHVNDLTHIDVAPQQIISETTALIPFLEHDDNTRASMGSNMQRQAVSLVRPHAPIVGTGMEGITAKSSGQVLLAEENGTVLTVDASRIIILYDSGKRSVYNMAVYVRSNQGTSIHQRVRCYKNQRVKKGQVLADGPAVDNGEMALGQNLIVAYMSWRGYNFEDAVVISESVLHRDLYSSVHIETFTLDVRDTKLGPEIITRDIPNVGEVRLKDLDEEGIIRIGATVHEGDILVGKITPKGETELTAEERLLRAIFGDKARDVKDTSLRLPGGEGGKVVDIQIFTRQNGDELTTGVNKQVRVSVAQMRRISIGDKIAGRHGNKGIISLIVPVEDMPYLPDGRPVDIVLNPLGVTSRMNIGQILETHLGWAGYKLGLRTASPALDGMKFNEITELLHKANLPENGKIRLIDGVTGEPFDHETTIGVTYIMKLSHLIEDKIHARSVGPYSLVTQQPLGGKAQHGGQRFGEMEVWALEAYGAAHTLQEMLTIKSDDVFGRAKAYESIIKGELIRKPRTPASFHVLMKELQSLGLSVNLLKLKQEENMDDEEYVMKEDEPEVPDDKIHNEVIKIESELVETPQVEMVAEHRPIENDDASIEELTEIAEEEMTTGEKTEQ